jgi:hypothetical protein
MHEHRAVSTFAEIGQAVDVEGRKEPSRFLETLLDLLNGRTQPWNLRGEPNQYRLVERKGIDELGGVGFISFPFEGGRSHWCPFFLAYMCPLMQQVIHLE